MIVQAVIDENGAITIHVDSDGDQGQCWTTEVMRDALDRAAQKAVNMWVTIHRTLADVPEDEDDGDQ